MTKHFKNNSSFDSCKSFNFSKEMEKETLNIHNFSIEEVLNIDDIIEKMSNYKNKPIFSQ